jgi:prevent-host-death family protein
MKVIEQTEAKASLGDYAAEIEKGAIIVTSHGKPVAALVPIDNTDLETASLCTNRAFLDLIDRSRTRVQTEGAISSEEMRRRFN